MKNTFYKLTLYISIAIISIITILISNCLVPDDAKVSNIYDERHPDYTSAGSVTSTSAGSVTSTSAGSVTSTSTGSVTSTSTGSVTSTSTVVCPTSAPTNVSASDGIYTDKISVTWDTVANATGYLVYRSTSETGTYNTLFATAITTNTYDDTTVTALTNYYYKVSAMKIGCVETLQSSSDVGIAGFITTGMVLVTGGTFTMGDTWGDGGSDELPTHSVTISSFYMDETEVTTGAFEAYINSVAPSTSYYYTDSTTGCNINTNDSVKDNHPVNCVTWDGAYEFCEWKGKRLPTEAEWEYAAGGGSAHWKWSLDETTFTSSKYCYNKSETCTVKSYSANSLGLYDMTGNVFEWCKDWYESSFYNTCSPSCTNPENTYNVLNIRVIRGCSFAESNSTWFRTSQRLFFDFLSTDNAIGFRCVQN